MEESLPESNATQEPLEIYIAYDALPALQARDVLSHVDATYDVVLSLFPRLSEFDFGIVDYPGLAFPPRGRARDAQFYGPQISVETVITGNSIKWGFGPPKQLIPKLKFKHKDLEVLFPRWTAAAVLTGAVLIGGLHTYHEVLEVIKVQHEVREQLRNIDDTTGRVFDNERRIFQKALSTPNIQKVVVNGRSIALDVAGARQTT
jgi:hypothetical protein